MLSLTLIPLATLLAGMLALPTLAHAQTVNEPELVRGFSMYGSSIGSHGMVFSTAPGLHELFLDGGDYNLSFWHAEHYDITAATFVSTFASPVYADPIVHLGLGDVYPGSGDEILVVLENGEIHIHDQVTKQLLGVIASGISGVSGFAAHDLNADGTLEFAFLGVGGVHILDDSGALTHTIPGLYGEDLVIGQMDGDPGMEIAVTNGSVIDVNTLTVQCHWPTGFGFTMELSDFDNDGKEELIYSDDRYFAWAFDVDLCMPKWSLSISHTLSMTVGDSNQDGMDEIVLCSAQSGRIRSYALDTRAPQWSMSTSYSGGSAALFVDLDGNGIQEVLWGAGAGTSAEDHLIIGDYVTETVLWTSHDLRGPFIGPRLGDIDSDGVEEIVSLSSRSNSGAGGPHIIMLEQSNSSVLISQELTGYYGVDLEVMDIDQDARIEVVAACSNVVEIFELWPGGFVQEYIIHTWPFSFADMELADLDSDGQQEILIGGQGSGQVAVVRFNIQTGLEESRSPQLGLGYSGIKQLLKGDFDGDGQLEVAALLEGYGIYILAADLTIEAEILGQFHSLSVVPATGLGLPLLLFANSSGDLDAVQWNGSSYGTVGSIALTTAAIDAVIFPVGSTQFPLVSVEGHFELINRRNGGLLWQSADFGDGFGRKLAFLANGDFVVTGQAGIFFFRP